MGNKELNVGGNNSCNSKNVTFKEIYSWNNCYTKTNVSLLHHLNASLLQH